MFLKHTLRDDASHLYHQLNRSSGDRADINATFDDRYASPTTQEDISSQLLHLSISQFRKPTDPDDKPALEALTNRINRLIKLARPRDREEYAKVRFFREAVIETDWVSAQSPASRIATDIRP